MGLGEAISTCLRKYVTVSGRAARPEYWYFVLFVFLGALVAAALDLLLFGGAETMSVETTSGDGAASASAMQVSAPGVIQPIFNLATLLPLIAVACRRLHDTGRTGWWLLAPTLVSILCGLIFASFAGFGTVFGDADMEIMAGAFGGLGLLAGLAFMLVPAILAIIILVWLASRGEPGPNRFGPPPSTA